MAMAERCAKRILDFLFTKDSITMLQGFQCGYCLDPPEEGKGRERHSRILVSVKVTTEEEETTMVAIEDRGWRIMEEVERKV